MNNFIAWFVKNPVAANLLMIFIIIGGLVGLNTMGKTVFPSGSLDTVQITVPYLGANPADVEERILIPVEEAISGLQGIKRISSFGSEGQGRVNVDAIEGYDVDVLLNEIKARVDSINTFPSQAERPVVRRFYADNTVMFLLLYGDLPEKEMKELARDVRDKIAAIPGAEKSILDGTRDYEISVEVSELQLEKYGLTYSAVAQAIRRSSLNVGAGMIDDVSGQTQLMTRGQAYEEADFNNIVIAQQEDGNQILLRDVATVIDGFQDVKVDFRYQNQSTLLIGVVANENPDVVSLSKAVFDLIENDIRPNLPAGVEIDPLIDTSDSFKDRLNLLVGNGIGGLVLVFLGLTLFLTPRLAIWVTAGICISFLGCFWMMPYLGVPLSMLSMFAFVLILGIVVDDAVIIGESIHRQNEKGITGEAGAIAGAAMVSKPVIFSALTTMLAFSPLLFILGATRTFVIAIPVVVIVTLFFSLLESFCILPMHLKIEANSAKSKQSTPGYLSSLLTRIRGRADAGLHAFINGVYKPVLDKVVRRKFLTLMSFVSACIFIISFAVGGWVKFTFEPNVLADFIQVSMEFPSGVPYEVKLAAQSQLEDAANTVKAELAEEFPDKEVIRGTATWTWTGSTSVQGYMAVYANATRDLGIDEIARRWRTETGDVPDATDMSFQFNANNNESALYMVVAGNDLEQLAQAGSALKQKLAGYAGVYEVIDSNESASTEAVLSLLPGAENMGISLNDLATQVRQAFYGEEVQRIPRGKDTVKVMVRLPEEDRKSFDTLNELRIRTGTGETVPFDMVASVNFKPGVTQIRRTDRERTLLVTAKVDDSIGNLNEIRNDLNAGYLDQLRQNYSGISLRWAGSQEGQNEFMNSLMRNAMFALFAMFFLLAVAFRSYLQPLIIMTAIPCGYVGALLGHLILGLDLSLYSILGIVAAAGVVINDNLVLLDYINKLRDQGKTALQAVEQAAQERFRPIFLTSFTTFIGLLPLMSETSVQAQFMIPTVVSLAFGVLFASVVTLLIVPVLYLVLTDTQEFIAKLFNRKLQSEELVQES